MDARTHAAIVDDLAEKGWCVRPDAIEPALVAKLRAETLDRWQHGGFRHARVGQGAEKDVHAEVRRDWVNWLDPEGLTPAQSEYWANIEALRQTINESLYLGVQTFEAHLAVYPPDAFYRRHTDQFRGAKHRVVSVILYLNENWTAADGGQLRMYLPDGAGGETALDVVPHGGTLVTFLAARFEHEVLAARRQRMSLTGWMRTRDLIPGV